MIRELWSESLWTRAGLIVTALVVLGFCVLLVFMTIGMWKCEDAGGVVTRAGCLKKEVFVR